MNIAKDNTLRTLTLGLLLVLIFGFIATDWLRFLVQMSLATFLVVLGVIVALGRYTGFRLTEVIRFRQLAAPGQD